MEPVALHSVKELPVSTLLTRILLFCGILSSLLYVAMNVFVAMQWPEYSSSSQTVSELSAIGAPTRKLWVGLSIPYTFLVMAFGWGVWRSARENNSMKVVGGLIITYGALGIGWPFVPMHLRETLAAGGGTWTDTAHIAFGIVTVLLMLVAMAIRIMVLGRNFRVYSIVSMLLLLLFGILTTREAPGISENLPTPWIGVWERINIGIFLIWVIVLATVLLRGVVGSGTAGTTTRV